MTSGTRIFALIAVAATICAMTITPKLFQQQAIAQGAPNLEPIPKLSFYR